MTDRELLELAAKAAGLTRWEYTESDEGIYVEVFDLLTLWNPLTDDGDALRLAVKLGVELEFFANCVRASKSINGRYWEVNESLWVDEPNPYAATRRAIVRAAAEIGRTL